MLTSNRARGAPRQKWIPWPKARCFEEMFDHEDVATVNPTATRAEQLANIRQIYPPEREALGVVAIGIELVDPPRTGVERASREPA